MQYYRCKCGKRFLVGSYGPPPCLECDDCQTTLAAHPGNHTRARPHRWQIETVETDDGPKQLTRCTWCGVTMAEATKVKDDGA